MDYPPMKIPFSALKLNGITYFYQANEDIGIYYHNYRLCVFKVEYVPHMIEYIYNEIKHSDFNIVGQRDELKQ